MTILATIIVLGVLIFVHELGHFAAAKAVGVEVQRFSIGLGPKVWGFTRGETEYVLSAVPLGGYVKMGGMDDEVLERLEGGADGEPPREPRDSDFDQKPIWARTLVISAGVIMNMLFAFGVFTFLAAQYGIQEIDTTRVGFVDEELLPAGFDDLSSIEPGSRIVTVGGERVGHWGAMQQALLATEGASVEVTLVEPTQAITVALPEGDSARAVMVASLLPWVEAGVGEKDPGGPADQAGLERGDRIVAVDGEPTLNWWTLVGEIQERPGERVEFTVVRDDRELVRAVTLDTEEEEAADGSVREVGRAGIFRPTLPLTYRSISITQAVSEGWNETARLTGAIVGFVVDLFTGGISPRSVGSIVTIGQASGDAAEQGFDEFLRFMAFFSINLAVLNLLPIPVLDGGHLVFLAIEAIRGGRPLSLEQRLKWSNVGFLVIVGIMLWALSNDFLRLLGI